jgi:two-component system phosphate regulon sensor histidine kinase PhoR
MPGLLHRLVAGALAGVIGGLIGLLVGHERGAVIGALLGGLLGFLGVVLFDALRGWRLLRWLRGGSLATTAPRDSGFWGELGYRIERGLRALEREAELERTHLTQFLAAMEASPNGVLLLDANDQIQWCNSLAADHFGLDPERDRWQRVTNLIRSPAFVAYLQAGNFDEPIAVRDSRTPVPCR